MRMKLARSRNRATAIISPVQSWASRGEGVGVDTGRAVPKDDGFLVKSDGMVCQFPLRLVMAVFTGESAVWMRRSRGVAMHPDTPLSRKGFRSLPR